MKFDDRDASCELIYCCMCGAQNGDWDNFVNARSVLCFMEPIDSRFANRSGYQVKCSICAIGTLSYYIPEQQRRFTIRSSSGFLELAYSAIDKR